jgi:hypothetical protein
VGHRYRHGEPIPDVEYTPEEDEVWRVVSVATGRGYVHQLGQEIASLVLAKAVSLEPIYEEIGGRRCSVRCVQRVGLDRRAFHRPRLHRGQSRRATSFQV